MSSDPKKKEEELSDLINKAGEDGKQIVKRSQEHQQYGQFISDLSSESSHVIKYGFPPGSNIDLMIDTWGSVVVHENQILSAYDSISPAVTATSGTAVAYSMTELSNPDNVSSFVSEDKQDLARTYVAKLSDVINRQASKEQVLGLLIYFGLDKVDKGITSPAQLFETAWAAFERPISENISVSTSLIPLRECINEIISILLHRRPFQEPAGNESKKILSILNQLAYSSIPKSSIDSLANRWSNLNDELSSSKQKEFLRDGWRDTLTRSNLLIKELLQSLDKSKFKK